MAGLGIGSSNGPYAGKSRCVVIPDNQATVNTPASVGIIDYCGDTSGSLFTKGEIYKVHYDLSPTTSLEAGFVGSQGGYLPQGASYGQALGVTKIVGCLPSSPLACSNPNNANLIGTSIDAYTQYPGSNVFSNQPIFTGQLRTTIAGNTLLVRPYAGTIDAIIDGGTENQYPIFFSPAGTVPPYGPGVQIPPSATAVTRRKIRSSIRRPHRNSPSASINVWGAVF